jgi:D-alanyl-D-alanine carboxypeptidase/D-alanyl-D-alanine-endopeptidase (penicillin-binding protein 4)
MRTRTLLNPILFVLLTLNGTAQSANLQQQLDALLNVPWLKYGSCAVLVRSLETGETVYSHDHERVLTPASNMKLITSAAAITLLREEFRYQTRVLLNGTLKADGTLQGDLILQGGGDPVLEYKDLQSLAKQVYEAGGRKMEGMLLYDDSYFDAERYGFGWNIDDEPFGYQAQMSGLSVERNAARVYLKPGDKEGEPLQVRLDPPSEYLQVYNLTKTHATGRPNNASATRERARNVLIISGGLPLGAQETLLGRYSVENPGAYTASLFLDALKQAGVQIPNPRYAPLFSLTGKMRQIAEHQSRPMKEILVLLNKPSDNLIAEALIKTLGRVKRGRGTTAAGMEVVNEFLKGVGIEPAAAQFLDGSGLSRMNAVSAESLVRLLDFMYRSSHKDTFFASLPVMGVDGTLSSRLRDSEVRGKVFAKTGSLYRVSSLSGYLTAKSGKVYLFSILMNAFDTPTAEARQLQDRLVSALYEGL